MITITLTPTGLHTEGGALPYPRKAMQIPTIIEAREMPDDFRVIAPFGMLDGKKGDFLLTGAHGDIYTCPRHVYFATYQFIQDES